MKRNPELTHRIMSSIKSKDTTPERVLGSAMWRSGIRYRKHYSVIGTPDFVILNKKIAIFCDGDFWHGNNWRVRNRESLEEELAKYSDYWVKKIKSNINRDKEVNQKLKELGWKVLRFWESDIMKDVDYCVSTVITAISKKEYD